MQTDPSNASFIAGKVVGVFSVRGWVKIKPYTEDPRSMLAYQPWDLISPGRNDKQRKLKVVDHQFRPQGLVVKFDGLDDRDEAAKLNGWLIEVSSETLPALESGDYYWRDLIGLTVVSHWEGQQIVFGTVKTLLETGANDVLVVQGRLPEHADDQERLIPYVIGQYVTEVDLHNGILKVQWDPAF